MNYLENRIENDILIIDFQVASITDTLAVEQAASEWMQALESSGLDRLIIDFSSLEFLSSGLLGELIQLRRYCQANGISLKLCCLSKQLKDVLSLTQLSTRFKTYHSRRSAIECFAADNFVARHEFFARYDTEQAAPPSFTQITTTQTLDLIAESSNTGAFGL